MRSLQLAMTLLAKDQGSKVLRQTLADVLKQTNANKKAEEEAARVREQSAQSGIRASRTLQQEYQRAANARSVLGIRKRRLHITVSCAPVHLPLTNRPARFAQ